MLEYFFFINSTFNSGLIPKIYKESIGGHFGFKVQQRESQIKIFAIPFQKSINGITMAPSFVDVLHLTSLKPLPGTLYARGKVSKPVLGRLNLVHRTEDAVCHDGEFQNSCRRSMVLIKTCALENTKQSKWC